jgi:sterol desaturase/sphingolipid hydroxylase (fatty acid hydroxylase superfamily)
VLWPLHALHHQPRALDLLKTGRFHLVDSASFAFLAYVPLAVLGAPPVVLAWVVIVNTIGGLLQHANVRMPTPAWLDALVCTPAAHWRHHSCARADDGNYATLCMLIDRACGTWVATGGRRPARLGLEHDPLPPGWLASVTAPFRRRLLH